jgi:ATP-dependent protease HslVU (ClpYQ) ATPase subunit
VHEGFIFLVEKVMEEIVFEANNILKSLKIDEVYVKET